LIKSSPWIGRGGSVQFTCQNLDLFLCPFRPCWFLWVLSLLCVPPFRRFRFSFAFVSHFFLWGLSSEVFIRGFISSLPQRAWDKRLCCCCCCSIGSHSKTYMLKDFSVPQLQISMIFFSILMLFVSMSYFSCFCVA
jgi:hypothetical protein